MAAARAIFCAVIADTSGSELFPGRTNGTEPGWEGGREGWRKSGREGGRKFVREWEAEAEAERQRESSSTVFLEFLPSEGTRVVLRKANQLGRSKQSACVDQFRFLLNQRATFQSITKAYKAGCLQGLAQRTKASQLAHSCAPINYRSLIVGNAVEKANTGVRGQKSCAKLSKANIPYSLMGYRSESQK